MKQKTNKIQTDTAGNSFVEVPSSNGSGKIMRVSLLSDFYTPPVDEDGRVDVRAAAEELRQEISSGTLQFRSYLESGELGLPVEIKLGSRGELEAMIRAIRSVFKEGLERGNDVRRAGLERCQAVLKELDAQVEDRRRRVDRRSSERRGNDRRVWYKPPATDCRKEERRTGSDRRAKNGRRVA
jgi:hypothetical protein